MGTLRTTSRWPSLGDRHSSLASAMDWHRCVPVWHAFCCESWILVPNHPVLFYMRFNHQAQIGELRSQNDVRSWAQQCLVLSILRVPTGIDSPTHCEGHQRHHSPLLGAHPPHCLTVLPHQTDLLIPFQLTAWCSSSWYLGQLAKMQSEGMGSKTFSVTLHKLFKPAG